MNYSLQEIELNKEYRNRIIADVAKANQATTAKKHQNSKTVNLVKFISQLLVTLK